MTTTPAAFELPTPEGWTDFSISDEAAENRIAREVWQRAADAGFDPGIATSITESVRRTVRLARESGAVHAAGTFELYEDGPLIATVLASVVVPPENGDLLGALSAIQRPEQPDGTWRRVGTAHIDGIGTVGRVHGLEDVTVEDTVVRCAVMHTIVPLPGTPAVLVVTGNSPNVAEADEMFGLFDRITATLTLH